MNFFFRTYNTWNLPRVSRHIAYWLFWTVFYITFNSYKGDYHSPSQWAMFQLIVLPLKVSCTMVIAYVLMPKYLYQRAYLKFFSFAICTLSVFGIIICGLYVYIIYPHVFNIPFKGDVIGRSIQAILGLIHVASLFLCYKFFQNILTQNQERIQLTEKANEAQLKYLKNQIQPHFLFNTLNNLYGMILSNDEKSGDTVIKLSEMMSYMLYDSDADFVSLKNEIDNLKNYIELEKIRYNRKLDLSIDIPDISEGFQIAPLLLLPFVENAFKHGPAQEEEKSMVAIKLSIIEDTLLFEVSNTYNETETDKNMKSGIGLKNVKERLNILYPNEHQLKIEKSKLFTVNLVLPSKEML